MNAILDSSPVNISLPELVALRQLSQSLFIKKRPVSSQRSGDHHSAFKGRGMEFSESRPYQAGDDIRNLDWRVMARTSHAYTKLFCEERERPVHFVLDYGSSMFFATRGCYKSVYISRLAGVLAWAVANSADRVGGSIINSIDIRQCKPTRGKQGVLRLFRNMVEHSAWQQNIKPDSNKEYFFSSFNRLKQSIQTGSLVFIFSDFHGIDETMKDRLIELSRHTELVLISINDPMEAALPRVGTFQVTDGNKRVSLNTNDANLLKHYEQNFLQQLKSLQQLQSYSKIHIHQYFTNEDMKNVMHDVFRFT